MNERSVTLQSAELLRARSLEEAVNRALANGSAATVGNLVKGLTGASEQNTWTQQADRLVDALASALVYLRDNHGVKLDFALVAQHLELVVCEKLAWDSESKYSGLEASGAASLLREYLIHIPGYRRGAQEQKEVTHEQHGYLCMQLSRSINHCAGL
jgi:hypothetical protein